MDEESIIEHKNRLFNINDNYIDFKNVLNTYFKEQCPYLMKMIVKESDYGSEFEGNGNEFIATHPTIGYTGLIEKSECMGQQEYWDSLFILESVTNLFNDLEIKAKNVYNPFIPTLNTMYIRDSIHYYIYVDQNSKKRIIVVAGRFGFFRIKSHKIGIYEDYKELDSK